MYFNDKDHEIDTRFENVVKPAPQEIETDKEPYLIYHIFYKTEEGKKVLDMWKKRWRDINYLPMTLPHSHGSLDAYIGFCEGQKWIINMIQKQIDKYSKQMEGDSPND